MFRNRFYLFLLSRLLNGRDWIRRCLHRCKCVLCRDLYFFPLLIQNDNLVGYYMISLMMITAYVCRYLPCVYCCYIRHSFVGRYHAKHKHTVEWMGEAVHPLLNLFFCLQDADMSVFSPTCFTSSGSSTSRGRVRTVTPLDQVICLYLHHFPWIV